MNYLEIPQEVLGREDARELVRFWISDGDDYVTLCVDLFGDREAEVWGSVAADLLKHALLGMELAAPGLDRKAAEERMLKAFQARLGEHGIDYSGRLGL